MENKNVKSNAKECDMDQVVDAIMRKITAVSSSYEGWSEKSLETQVIKYDIALQRIMLVLTGKEPQSTPIDIDPEKIVRMAVEMRNQLIEGDDTLKLISDKCIASGDLQRWKEKCGVYMRQNERLVKKLKDEADKNTELMQAMANETFGEMSGKILMNSIKELNNKIEAQNEYHRTTHDGLKSNREKASEMPGMLQEIKEKINGNFQYLLDIQGKIDAYMATIKI